MQISHMDNDFSHVAGFQIILRLSYKIVFTHCDTDSSKSTHKIIVQLSAIRRLTALRCTATSKFRYVQLLMMEPVVDKTSNSQSSIFHALDE